MDLIAGAELPALVRSTGLPHWNRFAAVNDEFVPIHMDDEAARAAGFPAAIGMGTLIWSYFHRVLRDGISGGRIEQISARYLRPNLRDSTLTIRATIGQVAHELDGVRLVLQLIAIDETNTRLAEGEATVFLASGDEPGR